MSQSAAAAIRLEELHPALQDPSIGAMSFLNEVMSRYPQALSFAPGAPNLVLLDDFDISRYLQRYLDHVADQRQIPAVRARQLLLEYGPSAGLINPLIATALELDQGISVTAEDVVVTVGAQEALLLVLRALCLPGRDVLAVVSPSYVGVVGCARILDIDLVAVREVDGELDFDRLTGLCQAARSRGQRLRALYVAPDFANPSGTQLSLAARLQLLELAEQQDLYLIEDTAYGFTVDPAEQLPSLKRLDLTARVITIGTFAKVAAPGARVGYVVANQPIVGSAAPLAYQLALIKSMVTVNTSPICQAVIGGLLLEHGGSLSSLGSAKAALYRTNLQHLLQELRDQLGWSDPAVLSWTSPRGGFFVRMRLPVRADAALLEVAAADYGVLWTPMAPFYLDSTGDNEIRLSCSYLSTAEIHSGVSRLSCFLRSLPGTTSPSLGNLVDD